MADATPAGAALPEQVETGEEWPGRGFCRDCFHPVWDCAACPNCTAPVIAGVAPAVLPDLLPCPFCGGEAARESAPGPRTAPFLVRCAGDDCRVRPCTSWCATEDAARALWNTRHPLLGEGAVHRVGASIHPLEPVRGVVFVLVRDGEVLMEKCPKKAARHGGEWFLPGGRIEPGESPDEALRREMWEELGSDPGDVVALPLVDATGGDNWGSFLMRPYLIRSWTRDLPSYCLDHPDVPLRWVPLAEAAASPTYAVRAILAAVPNPVFRLEDAVRRVVPVVEPCGTCGGTLHASGLPCVCGGRGTQAAEVEGLRRALFDAHAKLGMYPAVAGAGTTPRYTTGRNTDVPRPQRRVRWTCQEEADIRVRLAAALCMDVDDVAEPLSRLFHELVYGNRGPSREIASVVGEVQFVGSNPWLSLPPRLEAVPLYLLQWISNELARSAGNGELERGQPVRLTLSLEPVVSDPREEG